MLMVGYICAFIGAFYAGFEIWRAWNPLIAVSVVVVCLALTLFVPVVGFGGSKRSRRKMTSRRVSSTRSWTISSSGDPHPLTLASLLWRSSGASAFVMDSGMTLCTNGPPSATSNVIRGT